MTKIDIHGHTDRETDSKNSVCVQCNTMVLKTNSLIAIPTFVSDYSTKASTLL